MLVIFFVALGGALGTLCRYLLSTFFDHWVIYLVGQYPLPFGIIMCNLTGCFMIGMTGGYFVKDHVIDHFSTPYFRAFLVTGFLGGYTTFSSFNLEALKLVQTGHEMLVAGYITVTIVMCILSAFVGFELVERKMLLRG